MTNPHQEKHPGPPSSGEVLGMAVNRFRLADERLVTRTAQRYFEGIRITTKSRQAIHEALADALVSVGFQVPEAEAGITGPQFPLLQ